VFNNLLNHYISCFEKEELITNFINKRILEKWLDRFVEENEKEDKD
jgi:lambda repressor-like predicted transcriptional regulator